MNSFPFFCVNDVHIKLYLCIYDIIIYLPMKLYLFTYEIDGEYIRAWFHGWEWARN